MKIQVLEVDSQPTTVLYLKMYSSERKKTLFYLCSHGRHPRSFPPSTFHNLPSHPESQRQTIRDQSENWSQSAEKVTRQLGLLKAEEIDRIMKNCGGLDQCKQTDTGNVCVFLVQVLTVCGFVWAYLVCNGSEDHGVRHERVTVYQPLSLRKVLYRHSKHQFMVEPAQTQPACWRGNTASESSPRKWESCDKFIQSLLCSSHAGMYFSKSQKRPCLSTYRILH